MDFYYVHGGIHQFNYSYVRDKDDSNKNAVAGQTDKMWFKPGDEGKVYPTPFYTSAVAEDNLSQYPNSLTVGKSDYLKLRPQRLFEERELSVDECAGYLQTAICFHRGTEKQKPRV